MKKLFIALVGTLLLYSNGIFSQIILQDQKWENGQTIKILFMDGTEAHHKLFKKAVGIWAPYVNLKFEFHELDPDYSIFPLKYRRNTIRVQFDSEERSNSRIGTSYNLWPFEEITHLNIEHSPLQKVKFVGTSVHEMGHALGLLHEHQHPDARNGQSEEELLGVCQFVFFLDISTESGLRQCKVNLAGIPEEDIVEYNMDLSDFDQQSVMLYDGIVGLKGFFNVSLSLNDKLFIAKHYPFDDPLTKEEIEKMHQQDREVEMSWMLNEYNANNCKLVLKDDKIYMEKTRGSRVISVLMKDQRGIDNYFPACSR